MNDITKVESLGIFSKRNTWRIIFGVLLIFLVICTVNPILENDTFYIIKIGEQFLNNGFDFQDHWAWSADIEINYPHFILNIALAVLYRAFGLTGIYAFVLIMSYLLALSLYYVMEKIHDMAAGESNNRLYPFVGIFVSILVLNSYPLFAVARSQLLTFLLWLWEMWFILRFINTGLKRYGVGIIILIYLCSLIHATAWYFSFILFIPFFASIYITKLKKHLSSKGIHFESLLTLNKLILSSDTECRNSKKLWIILLISYATGLLTPSRICYTSVFRINSGNPVKYIGEFKPLTWSNAKFVYIGIILLAILLAFFKTKCRLDLLFLFGGLFVMALTAFRHVALLVFVGSFAFFYVVFSALSLVHLYKIRETIKNAIVPLLAVLLLSVWGISKNHFYCFTYLSPLWSSEDAIDYIEENYDKQNLRLFNDYSFGAYMIFRDVPVFIDSRVNEYTKQFDPDLERDVFDDYTAIHKMQNNWHEVIEYYDFDGYYIPTDGPLYQYMLTNPDVELVWENPYVAIFMTIR